MKTINLSFFSLFMCLFLFGCDFNVKNDDDLEKAKIQIENYKWTEAERLLGRYLKEQENPVKRWEAWNELVTIINRSGVEPRITLEYLEAMLYEFENDKEKYKSILFKIGVINEDLWLFDRATDVWLTYINLDKLDGDEAISAHRRLARIYYLSRNFESAEDILNNCLGLNVNPNMLADCMYDLAEVNVVQSRWKEASDIATQILDMEVDQDIKALTLFLLADSLEQQSKFQAALDSFKQCQSIYPNETVVLKRVEYLNKKMK